MNLATMRRSHFFERVKHIIINLIVGFDILFIIYKVMSCVVTGTK